MPTDNQPSAWVQRYAKRFVAGSTILDLACGNGRHSLYLRDIGYQVIAVDRNPECLQALNNIPGISTRLVDLETPCWPLEQERFGGIVVSNYLYRPHLAKLADNLRADGALLYETFAAGNEQFGRPSNPDFLLQPSELRETFADRLHIVAFEEGQDLHPVAAMRQRIYAVGPAHPDAV